MGTITVDIWRKCSGKCKCSGISRIHVIAKAGDVASTGYGFSTHAATEGNTLKTSWKGNELERTNGIRESFRDLNSITTYYHTKYDGLHGFINRPLLVRVKRSPNKVYWYENAGHYLNVKWRRINDTNNYPEENSYIIIDNFKDKLDTLACDLYGLHGIYIDYDARYNFKCELCSKELNVNVRLESISQSFTKYKRYKYENLENASVLVYKGNKLKYLKQPRYAKAYYHQIPVDEDNYSYIGVYYWDADNDRNNPLMVEIATISGVTFWFENISKPDKEGNLRHDKWRLLPFKDNNLPNFHERLNALNCIYNKTVQINVGAKNCHDSKYATLHKVIMRSSYEEAKRTSRVFYTYSYESTRDVNESFNISNVAIDGINQTFSDKDFPFTNVRKFKAYVSPCDNKKPFLIYEERENQDNKWYGRRDNNGNWDKYPHLGKDLPEQVSHKIASVFDTVNSNGWIKKCYMRDSKSGVQLDITTMPNQGGHTTSYDDGTTSIIVTKTEKFPVNGFFGNLHKPTKVPFRLKQWLGGNHNLANPVPDVSEVTAYFWEGNLNRPVIIHVQKGTEKRYYSKGNGAGYSWLYERNNGKDLLNLLDHFNCENNDAIPIELTKPNDLSNFNKDSSLRCIGHTRNVISEPNPQPSLPKGTDYLLESYKITGGKKHISRVTYGGMDTNIPTYTANISHLRIYKWTGSDNPLLVEFKPTTGDSTWYENISKREPYTEWRKIEAIASKDFYDSNINGLTQKLTEKLDEINCTVNTTVQIQLDIMESPKTYCHNHLHKILVAPEPSGITEFEAFSHTPRYGSHFHVSSFKHDENKITDQNANLIGNFKHVKKVIVYFSRCYNKPLLFCINYSDGRDHKWYGRVDESNSKAWVIAERLDNKAPNQAHRGEIKNVGTIKHDQNISCISGIENARNKNVKKEHKKAETSRQPSSEQVQALGEVDASDEDGSDRDEEKKDLEGELGDILDQDIDDLLNDEEPEDEEAKEITQVVLRPAPGGILDKALQKITAPPGVIIDVQKNVTGQGVRSTTYGGTLGQDVNLEKSENTPYGFAKFKHTKNSSDGKSFSIREVQYNNQRIDGIKIDLGTKVKHVSVWYWTGDGNNSQPLLVEIEKEDDEVVYYESTATGGFNWVKYKEYSASLKYEVIEKELDYLNCKHNSVVVMDLSLDNSTRHTSGINNRYCCGKKHSNGQRVTVDKHKVSCKKHPKSNHLKYYKHDFTLGTTLSKIKYYENTSADTPRKRIEISGLDLPTKLSAKVTVYAFYCTGNDPKIIYVDYSGRQGVNGWYQKGAGDESQWVNVSSMVKDIIPNNIKDCGDIGFNQLVTALKNAGGCDYSKCKESTQSLYTGAEDIEEEKKKRDVGPYTVDRASEAKEVFSKELFNDIATTAAYYGLGGLDTALQRFISFVKSNKDTPKSRAERESGKGDEKSVQEVKHTPVDDDTSKFCGAPQCGTEDITKEGENGTPTGLSVPQGLEGSGKDAQEQQYPRTRSDFEDSREILQRQGKAEERKRVEEVSEKDNVQPAHSPIATPSASETPQPAKIFGLELASAAGIGSAFGVSSGTLAGAGATFFGGWKLYNRYKGDPWVRQI
ncbi:hypothetical protein BEWA_030340 [Theileria equi strain WA]|uniref:Uncharacterized protein n=1 Tax=Theileria equi strain WA TaxID=1537102 RepID=L0AYT1_THEEQ|nr:hypothetical protein BEWA_030340 [Theileria equi strain WA]AFZ80181.1 hypothetical protein BEWA_030340 [Theileria equi strain WA]|eukprot:XP_004829847.1 hypothetical protein BEWA_030340 [Theileria equi strain WA]